MTSKTFGKLIRQARKDKEYSQRELAKLIGVNFTYLSKLENDHADYPPSKEVIQSLAKHLDLDKTELTYLTGKINPENAEIIQDLLKQYKENVPVLLRRLRDNPEFAQKIFSEVDRDKIEEE